jgi:hypothetical protein
MERPTAQPASPLQFDNPGPVSRPATVIAVVPAHNEARFIGSVVLQARRFVETVVVVDDGSTDGTAQLAEDAGAEVVRRQSQGGKARALMDGFAEARRRRADVVVMLDGDAQHDPADIPSLVAPILSGAADVVIGSRFKGRLSEAPGWRRLGQQALTVATNVVSGTRLTDSQSGFRALAAPVVAGMVLRSPGLAAESEMQVRMTEHPAWRVVEVPIAVTYRDGAKRNPVWHGLVVVDTLVRLVAQRHPLLLLTLPGIVLALVGTWLAARLAGLAMNPSSQVTLLYGLAFVLFISGLVLAITGTLLHRLEDFRSSISELLGESRAPRDAGDAP